MEYPTLHFGRIECDEADVIHIPEGVSPFHEATRFLLLSSEEEAPFSWLQSLDDPALAFVVAPLDLLFPEYAAAVLARSDRDGSSETALLGITVLNADPSAATINLLAPILIDFAQMTGRQLVLDGPLESARTRLEPALEVLVCA